MIDREKALKTFNTYVSKYNTEDEKNKIKDRTHTKSCKKCK